MIGIKSAFATFVQKEQNKKIKIAEHQTVEIYTGRYVFRDNRYNRIDIDQIELKKVISVKCICINSY